MIQKNEKRVFTIIYFSIAFMFVNFLILVKIDIEEVYKLPSSFILMYLIGTVVTYSMLLMVFYNIIMIIKEYKLNNNGSR